MNIEMHRAFLVEAEKRKKDHFFLLEEFYGDEEAWKEALQDGELGMAVHYEGSLKSLLQACILYGYPHEDFIAQHLTPEEYVFVGPNNGYSRWEHELLKNFFLAAAVVALIRDEELAVIEYLESALSYHVAGLNAEGYQSGTEAINMLGDDALTILDIFVPHMVVNACLEAESEAEIAKLDFTRVEEAQLLVAICTLIRALSEDNKDLLNQKWDDLVDEWKQCYLQSNAYVNKLDLIILVYDLYCKAIGIKFSLGQLSKEFMSPTVN